MLARTMSKTIVTGQEDSVLRTMLFFFGWRSVPTTVQSFSLKRLCCPGNCFGEGGGGGGG